MAGLSEAIDTLLPGSTAFAKDELKALVTDAKNDDRLFIRHIGELTEEYVQLRALGQLTNDEFRELMEDVVDLGKMQTLKLSVAAQARAQHIRDGIVDLVLNKLLALI